MPRIKVFWSCPGHPGSDSRSWLMVCVWWWRWGWWSLALLPGVWKFIRRNSTGSVGWWEGNSLPLGRLPFLASDSALFLKEIHHILQDKPVFGQSEQHCKRSSTHARDAHFNVTRPGVVRAASTACLRYGSSACSHLSGWLLQWKRREGEQRVSTQNKHRSPCHKSWYSERRCIWKFSSDPLF